jgi:hypothetical protein
VSHSDGRLCGNCGFFAADKGQCRRYAPRPFTRHPQPEDELKLDAFWPWVQPEDWCGEYEGFAA